MSWEHEVKRFVESRRLNEARKILEVVRPTAENNAALKYWQRVLGEAKVISKTPASGVSRRDKKSDFLEKSDFSNWCYPKRSKKSDFLEKSDFSNRSKEIRFFGKIGFLKIGG
jgi:hypothetical protein